MDHFPPDRSIYDVMIATQNNDSTIGRWKTEPKPDTVFGAKLSRLQALSPPAQTNKQRRSEEKKAAFLYEAVHLLLTNIFTLIFDRV